MSDILFTVEDDQEEFEAVAVADPQVSVVVPSTPVSAVVTLEGPAGPRGETGAAGDNSPVFGEVPAGSLDGINMVFTTANAFRVNSTRVSRNGIRETRGSSYTETGANEITFSFAPSSSDDIIIDYVIL